MNYCKIIITIAGLILVIMAINGLVTILKKCLGKYTPELALSKFSLYMLLLLIVIPIYFNVIVVCLYQLNFGDWLGFWGGYLGALFGIFGVYLEIRSSKINEQKKEVIKNVSEVTRNISDLFDNRILQYRKLIEVLHNNDELMEIRSWVRDTNDTDFNYKFSSVMGTVVNLTAYMSDFKIDIEEMQKNLNDFINTKYYWNLYVVTESEREEYQKIVEKCYNLNAMLATFSVIDNINDMLSYYYINLDKENFIANLKAFDYENLNSIEKIKALEKSVNEGIKGLEDLKKYCEKTQSKFFE